MEEFYKAIETRSKLPAIRARVNGEDIYNDICDQMEEKENGTYLFLSKKTMASYLNTSRHSG